jgi:hypothetical protein
MASGTDAAHTAEAERPSAGTARPFGDTRPAEAGTKPAGMKPADATNRTVADTERLGIDALGLDADIADQPAHRWEVGEADSWEPSVTDTWNPPAANPTANRPSASRPGAKPPVEPEAGETETRPAVLPDERSVPPTVSPAERAVRSARQALDQALLTEGPEAEAPAPQIDPARMAISLASLAAERMRAGVPAGDGLVTGFGLARQTATGLIALGERLLEPAARLTAGAVQSAARLPVAGRPIRAALRSGEWVARSGNQAREKLRAWIDSARHPGPATPESGALESSGYEASRPEARDREPMRGREAGPASLSSQDSPQRTFTDGSGPAASRP